MENPTQNSVELQHNEYKAKCTDLGDLILRTNKMNTEVQLNNKIIGDMVKELTDLHTKLFSPAKPL